MRRTLGAMRDFYILKLQKEAAKHQAVVENDRIASISEMFQYVDRNLSGDPETKLRETMISADFTYAIQEFVTRLMFPAYTQKTFGFEPFVKPDTAPNYLPVTRYQNRAEIDDLEFIMEKGEARPGHVDDATKRAYQVYRWGKQYDFSMAALVNDDLGYFNDLATKLGRSARRSLEKYVSRMMWNATSVARLVGLGALYSTTGRLTTARISTARMAFNQRTDARGEPINAALRYIIYHPGLADTVDTIRQSTIVPETLFPGAANVARSGWTPIEDPYVTGAAPNLPWYAMASWQESGLIPFVLLRRQGMSGPLVMRKKSDIETVTSLLGPGTDVPPIWGDFATHNIVFQVVDEWGTYIDATEGNLFDVRGSYYSSGTVA